MLRSPEAIIFDFDGTLIDSSAAIVATFKAVLREFGLPARGEDWIRRGIGRPLPELFRLVSQNGVPSQEELVGAYVRLSQSNGFEQVQLLPGARETLDHFGDRARFGIATSRGSASTRAILERLGLQSRFDAIVGIDMVRHPKPDPECVEQVLVQLEIEATHAVLVGDTPDDIAAAIQAGVLALGVTTGAHSAEALRGAGASGVIRSLFELLGGELLSRPT